MLSVVCFQYRKDQIQAAATRAQLRKAGPAAVAVGPDQTVKTVAEFLDAAAVALQTGYVKTCTAQLVPA